MDLTKIIINQIGLIFEARDRQTDRQTECVV